MNAETINVAEYDSARQSFTHTLCHLLLCDAIFQTYLSNKDMDTYKYYASGIASRGNYDMGALKELLAHEPTLSDRSHDIIRSTAERFIPIYIKQTAGIWLPFDPDARIVFRVAESDGGHYHIQVRYATADVIENCEIMNSVLKIFTENDAA